MCFNMYLKEALFPEGVSVLQVLANKMNTL